MKNQVIVLGTGTSTGIPVIGCRCAVCTSADPTNKRLRTSVCLRTARGKLILIDTSPDLRYQILRSGINNLDAALITHAHADHVHGIDDLRPFCFGRKRGEWKVLPLYAGDWVASELVHRFPYIFMSKEIFTDQRPIIGGGIPRLDLRVVKMEQTFSEIDICGEIFTLFKLPHGYTSTLGFVHESLAYTSDCSEIPETVLAFLQSKNIKILMIDCLRRKKHQTHLNLEQVIGYVNTINPQFTGTIHLSDNFDNQSLTAELNELYRLRRVLSPIRPLVDEEILEY
ncbi:MAG: MBL fold metallo-hydrolase [Oligoflexia bacterium]|nr:MBL fold metallo-hydrolase [Oligoflexia bacterium]